MTMVEINWRPNDRTLRQFGWVSLVMFPLLAWLFGGLPLRHGWTPLLAVVIVGLAGCGLSLAVLGQLAPAKLRWLYIGLSLLALPIGLVVGELLIAAMFFLVFTPVALVFRLLGRDALERAFERSATTYWRPKRLPADVRRYFRQF